MNDIWDNLMSYFQNTNVGRGGQGVVSREVTPPAQPQTSPSAYTPKPLPKDTGQPFVKLTGIDRPQFPEEYIPYLMEAQNQYQIDPQMLASLTAQETGGYGYEPVRGTSGERGITQIIPDIWAGEAGMNPEEYGMRLENDPRYAILEAARILSQYRKQFPGNEYAAYNAGPNYEAGLNYQEEILNRLWN